MARLLLKYGAGESSVDDRLHSANNGYKTLCLSQRWFRSIYFDHLDKLDQDKIVLDLQPKIQAAVQSIQGRIGDVRLVDAEMENLFLRNLSPEVIADIAYRWPNVLHDFAKNTKTQITTHYASCSKYDKFEFEQRPVTLVPSAPTMNCAHLDIAFFLFSRHPHRGVDVITNQVDLHTNLPLLHTVVATCHNRSALLCALLDPPNPRFSINEPLVGVGLKDMLAPGATPLHALLSGVGAKLEPEFFDEWKNSRLDGINFHNPLLENMYHMVKTFLECAGRHPGFDINRPDSNG